MNGLQSLSIAVVTCVGLTFSPQTSATGLLDWFKDALVSSDSQWPQWQGYKAAFISKDGRVVDHSMPDQRTVSEGQAYGLFLALVANDRPVFDRLLTWTKNNLSRGDLKQNLPAWLWGKTGEQWGVIDSNSASDADLWIVYALLEAGRLWCDPSYTATAEKLADQIVLNEVLEVPGLGTSLLPGRIGFVLESGGIKLNPSYVPPFLMARLAQHFTQQPAWAKLYLGSQNLMLESVRQGLYPDWVEFKNGLPEWREPLGDYDAIRVYLWLGMTPPSDPIEPALLKATEPFVKHIGQIGFVPESWNVNTGQTKPQQGPSGFQYALSPLLKKHDAQPLVLPVMPAQNDQTGWRNYGYYNGMLSLFAHGHLSGRYEFDASGRLLRPDLGPEPQGGRCE